MNKFFRGILVGIILLGGIPLTTVQAQVEIPKTSELFQVGNEMNISEISDIRDYTYGSDEAGELQFREAVIKLVSFLKKMMIPIAIILLVYGGVKLYLTHGDEEEYKQSINQIAGIGTGFLLMMVAVNLVDWVFFGKSGEIFRGEIDPTDLAKKGMMEIVGIFDYLTMFAVALAVAFIVWNAITLIIAGGEDESQISEMKKRIIYGIIGIIILVSAKPMISLISTGDGGLMIPSVSEGISFVAKWVNFILGLVGVFAVIAIIYAGIRLIMHFGDEEATTQAKNIIIGAIIGLIITFSAWTIVNYFIAP
jgi:hypothetical protein